MEKIIAKTPELLYRYFCWEQGCETLSTRRLKLSKVSFYNDPFEFFPASNYTDKLSNLTLGELQEYIRSELTKYENQLSGTDLTALGLGTTSYVGVMGLVSFGTLLPIAAIVGAAAALWGANRISNKEELDKLKKFVETYLNFINNVRSCCFSESYDNILMWSHYADKHQGMAIAFKTSVLYWKEDLFKKIRYSEKRVQIPTDESDSTDFVDDLITTKAKCWEYEREWRLIKYDAAELNSLKIGKEFIDSIYLGLRVPQRLREEILHLRDKSYKDVKIKMAYKSNDDFELQFKEI